MEHRESMTAALLKLVSADDEVTVEEANAAWRFAREQGLGPEALILLAGVAEEDILAGLRQVPREKVAIFMASALEVCMVDQEMHPEELRLFTRFATAVGGT